MSDRTITCLAPSSLWTWQLGLLARGAARPATSAARGARIAAADFGGAPRPNSRWLAGVPAKLRAAWRRQLTRRCLAELDACALKDIGVSYAEAEAEANKPFWVA